jgi:hypothetical protein
MLWIAQLLFFFTDTETQVTYKEHFYQEDFIYLPYIEIWNKAATS